MKRMLVINPGSTSTKIAVYDGLGLVFQKKIEHPSEEIAKFETIYEQHDMRKAVIDQTLVENDIDKHTFSAILARGGLVRQLTSGTYEVNEAMVCDAKKGIHGHHAANLACIIANEYAKEVGVKAYIVDPVVVDELDDIARITGLPNVPRKSLFHALNQKSVGRHAANELGKKYEECNLIIAHMGGGISVGAHKEGRVIDVNNALLGDGPFSAERCGTMPIGQLVDMCFEGTLEIGDIKKLLAGKGGLTAHLGTNSGIEVTKMIENGDEHAAFIYEAMAYNIAKEIGSCAVVLEGKVDAIVLTGGQAFDERFVGWIRKKVDFLGLVIVFPGEEEMKALAEGGYRILTGEEKAKQY